MMPKMVALLKDGRIRIHMPGNDADYATLCGIDNGLAGEADGVSSEEQPLPPKAKIDCPHCKKIWNATRGYKASDFN